MAKQALVEVQIPEIRFRPARDVYVKAAQIADTLGLTITDVARMGLTQIANAREIRLVQPDSTQALLDVPAHGVTVGRIAEVAAAGARAADRAHVEAGRLEASGPKTARRTKR